MPAKKWRSQYRGRRLWAVLIGLTFFFFIDDFLMVFLIEEFQLFHVSKWVFYLIYVWLLAGSIVLAYAALYILQRKPTTGAEGLQDQIGSVIGLTKGQLQVRVRGEIWAAHSQEELRPGDTVIVDFVDGLTLMVRGIENKEEVPSNDKGETGRHSSFTGRK